MDITIITTVLNMLLAIIPQLTTSKQINGIVATLVNIVPIIAKTYTDLLPIVQNVIALLQQSTAVNSAQMATLKALDAQVDAAFDQAWAAYQSNHPDPQVTAG